LNGIWQETQGIELSIVVRARTVTLYSRKRIQGREAPSISDGISSMDHGRNSSVELSVVLEVPLD